MSDARPTRTRIVPRSPFWWGLSKWTVLIFCKLYFRLRTEGRHHVPATGPVLLVANHASYVDPPLVGITAGRWVAFLAQAGLAKLGPLRWWLGQMGVTLIDRNAPSKEALRLVAECLANGEAVGIFPEGTRSADGTVGPFRNGVEFLVRRTGASVVPIGLDGNHRAFPRRAWLPRPHKLAVRYGEPMTAEQILAPGGVETLRRRVAALANAPLRGGHASSSDASSSAASSSAGLSSGSTGAADSERSPLPPRESVSKPSAGAEA